MTDRKATVVLLGALDTRGSEFAYVKRLIEGRGHRTLTLDTSSRGEPAYAPDLSAADILASAGEDLESLRWSENRDKVVNAMAVGVVRVIEELHQGGRLDAILCLGGRTGTFIAAAALRNLPVGVPKVLVSTLPAGEVFQLVGAKDVTLIHPIIEARGLNRVTRGIMTRAAGAISGMVETCPMPEEEPVACAALSVMEATNEGCDLIRSMLEARGVEVIDFMARGRGGDVMEELSLDRIFDVVVDITTIELVDTLCGGGFPCSGGRLTGAGYRGIPQVVGPGGVDTLRFGPRHRLPVRFSKRNVYVQNQDITLVRIDEEEARIAAGSMARRLNGAVGPVRLVWPMRGVSALDDEEMPFYDPQVDAIFLEVLQERLEHADERLIEVDAHINDRDYAVAVCKAVSDLCDLPPL